jgi:hypothetical protein
MNFYIYVSGVHALLEYQYNNIIEMKRNEWKRKTRKIKSYL